MQPKRREPLQAVQVFGKKKTATAVAHCKRGRGLIRVNGRPLDNIEPKVLQYKLQEPLLLLGKEKLNSQLFCPFHNFSFTIMLFASLCFSVYTQTHMYIYIYTPTFIYKYVIKCNETLLKEEEKENKQKNS